MKKIHLMLACVVVLTDEQKKTKSDFLAFIGDSCKTVVGFDIDPASVTIGKKPNGDLIARVKVKALDLSKVIPNADPTKLPAPADTFMSYNMNGACIGSQLLNLIQDVTKS